MSVQSIMGQPVQPPVGAMDGGGFTAKVGIPKGSMTFNGVKDTFVKKPAKNDPSQSMTPSMEAEQSAKANKRARVISAVVLLVGGALLGYGHRKHIEKGINSVKGKVGEFFSKGKPAELLGKGKDLLAKAKDAIFVKQPIV